MPVLDALPSQATLPLFLGSIFVLFVLNHCVVYRRALNSIRNHPGFRHIFPIHGILANALPAIPWIAAGENWSFRAKHRIYAERGWDVLSSVGSYPSASVTLLLADPVAIKEVTTNRARFPKDVRDYTVLGFFGPNIVGTEGEEWKKHRKIAAPAFSEKNNRLVWDETIRITLDMFESWGTNPEVIVDHCVDITLPIALSVIGIAGFGRRVSWAEDKYIPQGHRLSFKDALHNVSRYTQYKLITPKWMYRFSTFLRDVQLAFDELELYMQEMIEARKKSEVKVEKYDLFSALLDASEEDKEGGKLSDHELIGDIFIFNLAGHETTAHTLSFAYGLLALEQDEQEKLYQHIKSVMPDGKIPGYESINMFTYSLAVIYETLRLFPAVTTIPKYSPEDTSIPATRPDGTTGTVAVPKGTKIFITTPGLHYNPRYWHDPESFNPSRFLGDWPRDAFVPFSAGPRACLGRRFFEIEAIATLTMTLSKYKVELKDPELYEGLSHLEKREKLLACWSGMSTTPYRVPLVFKRR